MPVGLQNTDLRKPQMASRRQFFAGGADFAAVGGRTCGACAGVACARIKPEDPARDGVDVSAAAAAPMTDPLAITAATHNK